MGKRELMKRIGIFMACVLCLTAISAQIDSIEHVETELKALKRVDYPVFQKGEKLEYLVHYGFINAGTAVIEVREEEHEINGRDVLHLVGTGKSRGAFDWFFKVRDYYESYVDTEHMYPYIFTRDVSEGGYEFEQNYVFFHHRRAVKTQKDTWHHIPQGVQDLLSAYYFARTLDMDQYAVGDVIVMQAFVDEKLEPLRVRYVGRETIKTKSGEYRCLKFQPMVQPGRIFNEPEDLTVFVTDDKNKIPVLAKANILVGSIKMELISYENVKYPIAKESK